MEKYIEEKFIDIIEKIFYEKRKIVGLTPDEDIIVEDDIYQGGFVFKTEEGEFIDLEIQIEDYDIEDHVNYIEFAECLYEKHHKKVSIYVLCAPDIKILIKPYSIYSDAEFNIKLAQPLEKNESLFKKIKDIIVK